MIIAENYNDLIPAVYCYNLLFVCQQVSYLIVDTLLLRTPPLTKDIYYDDESPVLPYTEASAEFKKKTYRGSVANMV